MTNLDSILKGRDILLSQGMGLSFPFLRLLPGGKDILESSLLHLQIPCRAQTWPS